MPSCIMTFSHISFISTRENSDGAASVGKVCSPSVSMASKSETDKRSSGREVFATGSTIPEKQ